jgi:vancomycin permeability regulator SanA
LESFVVVVVVSDVCSVDVDVDEVALDWAGGKTSYNGYRGVKAIEDVVVTWYSRQHHRHRNVTKGASAGLCRAQCSAITDVAASHRPARFWPRVTSPSHTSDRGL